MEDRLNENRILKIFPGNLSMIAVLSPEVKNF